MYSQPNQRIILNRFHELIEFSLLSVRLLLIPTLSNIARYDNAGSKTRAFVPRLLRSPKARLALDNRCIHPVLAQPSEPSKSCDKDRNLYPGYAQLSLSMELGARQVAKDLEPSRGLAYSTISTTLDRLYKKGMLARDEAIGRGGSRYIYMIHSEEKVKGKVVKGFVDRLLTAFGPTVISTLSDYVDDIPKDELKRLEEKIRKGSKQRST